jgi:arginyl-tRNA synthetase
MSDPLATLNALLEPVFAELAGGEPADPTVRPSDRADAQVNGALPLAKRVGANPRELADRVIASGVLDEIASAAEVAGPGFINVTFSPAFLSTQLDVARRDGALGLAAAEPSRKVVVDYSAPNVAKEMHVGHLRTTVIGDALVRMLEAVGHEVIRENHIGDWGTPFGMLIEHLREIDEDGTATDVGDLDEFYKQARVAFDASQEFQERSRQRVVKLQAHEAETLERWQELVDISTRHFNRVYDKLGVLLTDDDLMGESRYQPLMPGVIERLDEAGLLEQSDGADVVFPPGFENRDGDPLPLIVQKGTGGFNYATSDLACIIDRTERLGADLLLYVVDAGQGQHFQMVYAVAEMAGWLAPPTEAVHVQFGVVLGEDRRRLRSRSGEPVKFVDLLDEAVERAAAAIAEKNPDLDDEARAEVANAIGIGAVKYAELSTDRVKDYIFDWDRLLAFEGNTAPYLQYAHARICSLFRRAEVERDDASVWPITLGEDAERELALQILAYPTAVAAVLDGYSPHKLCNYVYDLATAFTSFYEKCPILRSDEEVKKSRLALADLTARVLAAALGLLGIEAPERM